MNPRGSTLSNTIRIIHFGFILLFAALPVGIVLGAKPGPVEDLANSSILNQKVVSITLRRSKQDSSTEEIEDWNPRFEHFSIPDGLPSSSIREITQDSMGFLWIATLNGLSRFDGYDFTNYHIDRDEPELLSFVEVNTVYTDLDGDLWVGTPRGLSFYDSEAGLLGRNELWFG
jgi:hypothetical protein